MRAYSDSAWSQLTNAHQPSAGEEQASRHPAKDEENIHSQIISGCWRMGKDGREHELCLMRGVRWDPWEYCRGTSACTILSSPATEPVFGEEDRPVPAKCPAEGKLTLKGKIEEPAAEQNMVESTITWRMGDASRYIDQDRHTHQCRRTSRFDSQGSRRAPTRRKQGAGSPSCRPQGWTRRASPQPRIATSGRDAKQVAALLCHTSGNHGRNVARGIIAVSGSDH